MPLVAFWFSFYTWEEKERQREICLPEKHWHCNATLWSNHNGSYLLSTPNAFYIRYPITHWYLGGTYYPFLMIKKRRVIVVELGLEPRDSDSRACTLNHSLDCPLGVKTGRKHLPKITLMEGCLENMQSVNSPRHFKFHLQIKEKH